MLSNRNTPFDADGFALIVEDMRRLAKSVYGGSNDLNSDAIAVSQETVDGSDALDAHVAAADPHPQYALADDLPDGFPPTAAETLSMLSSFNNNVAADQSPISGYSDYFDNSGGAWNPTAGIYTAPSGGYYRVSAFGVTGISGAAATTVSASVQVRVNGIGYFPTIESVITMSVATITTVRTPWSSSGVIALTSGDQVSVYYINGGGATKPLLCTLSIHKLSST